MNNETSSFVNPVDKFINASRFDPKPTQKEINDLWEKGILRPLTINHIFRNGETPKIVTDLTVGHEMMLLGYFASSNNKAEGYQMMRNTFDYIRADRKKAFLNEYLDKNLHLFNSYYKDIKSRFSLAGHLRMTIERLYETVGYD